MRIKSYLIKVNSDKDYLNKINYYHLSTKRVGVQKYLISALDYQTLTKYVPSLEIVILKDYTTLGIIKAFLKKKYIILYILLFVIIYFLLTNLIINVTINTSDHLLKDNIKVSLKNYDLKPLSFKKSYQELNVIKAKLLREYKNDIEWLEIKRLGMSYQVLLVKRIPNRKKTNEEYCNIYAVKEGLINRIIYREGLLVVNQNDLVKKDDLLISGKITDNEEVKGYVCATGKVYAEVWYTISLSIPTYETKAINQGKSKYNLYYEDKSLLKPQFSNYQTKTIKKLSKVSLVKETKITYQKVTLTEEQLMNKAFTLIKEKLDVQLNQDYVIIDQKVLKKSLNNSTMDIVVFISVEENIAKQKIEMKE